MAGKMQKRGKHKQNRSRRCKIQEGCKHNRIEAGDTREVKEMCKTCVREVQEMCKTQGRGARYKRGAAIAE